MNQNGIAVMLSRVDASVRKTAVQAVGKAGLRLLRDTVADMPTVPLDEGELRGSASLHVNGTFVTSGSTDVSTPNTDAVDAPRDGSIEAIVGFNKPYAAYQHEGMRADGSHAVVNYSEPSSGAKFLESKMASSGEEYLGIIAREIGGAVERVQR